MHSANSNTALNAHVTSDSDKNNKIDSNINSANSGVTSIVNSHDTANIHSLTNVKDSNENNSNNINTNDVVFNNFLNNEIATGPQLKDICRLLTMWIWTSMQDARIPMPNALRQNRNLGTNNNNDGSNFGWGQNRKPTKNGQNYQKIEQ